MCPPKLFGKKHIGTSAMLPVSGFCHSGFCHSASGGQGDSAHIQRYADTQGSWGFDDRLIVTFIGKFQTTLIRTFYVVHLFMLDSYIKYNYETI